MTNKISSASELAKSVGMKSLAEVSQITGKHANTLTRWYKDEPALFRAVILGCVVIKENPAAARGYERGDGVLPAGDYLRV